MTTSLERSGYIRVELATVPEIQVGGSGRSAVIHIVRTEKAFGTCLAVPFVGPVKGPRQLEFPGYCRGCRERRVSTSVKTINMNT